MLKHRIIPVLLTDGVQCVKPVSFQRPYRKLGMMDQYIQVIERRNVDELIIIDIEATPQGRKPNYEKLRRYCSNLFCPVTYGGGISTLDDIREALNNGADKVCIKTNKMLIPEAAHKFGAQAIVLCIDYRELGIEDTFWILEAQNLGAGEILLTNINRDGKAEGYDLETMYRLSKVFSIPIILSGGCGRPEHMAQALDVGADAIAAGTMFLYTEHTPKSCAKYLEERGYAVRV